jgi:hypothetical protein
MKYAGITGSYFSQAGKKPMASGKRHLLVSKKN